MVQLLIDQLSGKILGFNNIITDDHNPDIILIDDNELDKIKNKLSFNNLYYKDGEIIEYSSKNDYYKDYEKIISKLSEVQKLVDNEKTIFMDNIIDGMSIEDAAKISKENREKLDELQIKQKEFLKKRDDDLESLLISKFEKEEKSIDYKYFLSMLAVVRDENEYLEEWISWHIEKCGFDHFYIYDNESKIPVKEYLESINFKYIDKLTIIEWKTTSWTQQDICNDFLLNFKNETKWAITTDPDELIFIKDDSLPLKDFLQKYNKFSSIKIPWVHFNANGHETKPEGTMYENYTIATTWDDYKKGGKHLFQTNRVIRFGSYVPVCRNNSKMIDYDEDLKNNYFQLNHYYTKSYEEWVNKIKRGSSNPNFKRKYKEFFELNPDMMYLYTGEDFQQEYGSRKDD